MPEEGIISVETTPPLHTNELVIGLWTLLTLIGGVVTKVRTK